MSISDEFCNAFINAWDKNMSKFIKKYGDNGVENNNILVINNNETVEADCLANAPLLCFYTMFNGSVCDEDHRQYFNDCLTYAYKKTNFTLDHIEFLNSFIECWNENNDKFMKQVYDRYNYERPIVVVAPNELRWFELTPKALQCFYIAFNGSVCDLDHWQYFLDCLEITKKTTGIYTETYNICRRRNYYV